MLQKNTYADFPDGAEAGCAGRFQERKHAEDQNQMEERNMSVISMEQLLEAGVHFGHQTRRVSPKKAPSIHNVRNGI